MKRTLPLLLLCQLLLLAACATNAEQPSGSSNVNSAMEAWKGKRVTQAIGKWGMPDSINREGTVGVLVWKADETAGTELPALPEGMAWADLCKRVLTVDPSETIVEARAYGNGCSTDPIDYAPR